MGFLDTGFSRARRADDGLFPAYGTRDKSEELDDFRLVEIAKAIGEQVEAAHELASQAVDVAEFSAPLVIASAAGWGGGTLAAGGGGMTGGVAALGGRGVAAFAVIAVGA